MNLRLIDIFKSLLKWKYWIAAVVILAFFAARYYVSSIQTSVGRVVIQYNDASVSNGQFPDGEAFDQYQIVSPEVLQKVINSLGLSDSVESLRRRIEVSAIIPSSVQELKTAKAKDGEEYVYYPDTFIVSYNGKGNQMAYRVRELLETLVFQYIDYYSESYNSYANINNALADENLEQYDYIEVTEIMEENIDSILTSLGKYWNENNGFRSTGTGYSFRDLMYEYEHLQKNQIPSLYAAIYEGRISRNVPRLVEVYRQRMDEAILRQKNFEETAQMTKSKMDAFSEANKELPNAYNYRRDGQNNDDLAIIDGVYDGNSRRYAAKTPYDTLIEDYTNQLVSANDAYLESVHDKEVAEIFSSPAEAWVDVPALTEQVKQNIQTLSDRMLSLYTVLSDTIADYNDYSAQKHISQLTGVKCNDSVSASLYEMVAVVLSLGGMIMLALIVEIVRAYKKEETAEESQE